MIDKELRIIAAELMRKYPPIVRKVVYGEASNEEILARMAAFAHAYPDLEYHIDDLQKIVVPLASSDVFVRPRAREVERLETAARETKYANQDWYARTAEDSAEAILIWAAVVSLVPAGRVFGGAESALLGLGGVALRSSDPRLETVLQAATYDSLVILDWLLLPFALFAYAATCVSVNAPLLVRSALHSKIVLPGVLPDPRVVCGDWQLSFEELWESSCPSVHTSGCGDLKCHAAAMRRDWESSLSWIVTEVERARARSNGSVDGLEKTT
jgi:hypothetical protein